MMELEEQVGPSPAHGWKKDAAALALLVALVLPLRLWLLVSTEVAARDSIGYIRYALEFESRPWDEVIRSKDQHPGYALSILAVSQPLRWISGQTDAVTMQLAAQLTSILAAIMLLYPMYHLGRLLFNRRVGFGAALLFQYLPISAHHLSDGVSEGFFLLLVASALLQAVRALQQRSLFRFALCGVLTGLGYLTRLEAAMVAMATLMVLAALPFATARRLSWQRCLASGVALVLATTAVGSVYVYVTGELTNRTSVRMIIRSITQRTSTAQVEPQSGAGGALIAISFLPSDQRSVQFVRSGRALTLEIGNGFHYVGVVPMFLGMACTLGRLRRSPGYWVLAVYCTMHAACLVALALTVSYISDRHVMVLVMCGSYFAVAGAIEGPRRVLDWIAGGRGLAPRSLLLSPTLWSAVVLIGMMGFGLPKALQPLHTNRAGNRAAGEWLATVVRPGDIVEDDHCWSHFYAGQVFLEGKVPAVMPGLKRTRYVVRTRSRDPEINQGRQLAEEKIQGTAVYHWPESVAVEQARVVVYACPAQAQ
jgi:hypothetical protein